MLSLVRARAQHGFVRPHGRSLEFFDELRGRRVGAVVAVHAFGHVPHGRFECQRAGLLAAGRPAHTVGDHGDDGESFIAQGQTLMIGEARDLDLHALVDRRDQERVLVVLAHQAGMRETV